LTDRKVWPITTKVDFLQGASNHLLAPCRFRVNYLVT